MKPKHVKEYEYAEKHRNTRHTIHHTLEYATDRLIDQWLGTYWSIRAHGQMWTGKLINVENYGHLRFSIEIPDPNNACCMLTITAPFEQFAQVEEERRDA